MASSCCSTGLSGYSLGVFFIVVVAVIWAGASVLTQWIYTGLDFQSPFLVTYLSTGLFALYLPLWRVWVWLEVVRDPPFRRMRVREGRREEEEKGEFLPKRERTEEEEEREEERGRKSSESSTLSSPPLVEVNHLLEDTAEVICGIFSRGTSSGYSPLPPDESQRGLSNAKDCLGSSEERAVEVSHEEVIVVALKVAPLWFIANCGYNYSLLLTSVGSSTIISNLSGTFTLFFAYMVGIEYITSGKLLALFVSLGGVALIAIQDEEDDSPQTLIGDIVALGAAAFYGLYTTTIRVQIPEENEAEGGVSMQLLFGYIGAITAVFLSPCLFFLGIFHLGNLGELTGEVLGFLVLGSIFNNVISDYLWARSVVLTSPTIATVGLSITIPLAILSDFIFFGNLPTYLSTSGAILVILGFLIISAEDWLRSILMKHFACLICWKDAQPEISNTSSDSA